MIEQLFRAAQPHPGGIDINGDTWHHYSMRTTINIDDNVIKEATRRARILRISLGKSVSDIARRGLQSAPPVREVNGLIVFDPPKDAGKITQLQVKEALSDFP